MVILIVDWGRGGYFIVVVVLLLFPLFRLLFLLTGCNRLQPIVIQCRRFVPIIAVTCCMGPVCAPVRLCWAIICYVWIRIVNVIVICRYCTHAYYRSHGLNERIGAFEIIHLASKQVLRI